MADLQIIKPGIQKNGIPVTTQILNEIVHNFNPDAKPPITLGHPVDSRVPAFGRVTSVYLDSGLLLGGVKKTPELIQLEKEGYYDGWSAGIRVRPDDGTHYLHHLAWLGELPPASETKYVHKKTEYINFNDDPNKDLIILDRQEERHMTKEEIEALVKQTDEANQQRLEKVEKLLEQLSTKNDEDTKPDTSNTNDDSETKKELAAVLQTIQSDRIKRIEDVFKRKGLDDNKIKPLMDVIKKYPSIDLADNADDGVYHKLMTFAEGLNDPLKDSLLTRSLINLDTGPNDQDYIDPSSLAEKL